MCICGLRFLINPTDKVLLNLRNRIPPYWTFQPTVSVGNVGQMTTDLLISTLGLSVVGYLYTDCVVPVVGSNPYAQHGSPNMFQLTTALEVFESTEHKLIIVQQRSPFVKSKRLKFVDELALWIKNCSFKQVFILTSVFAHERRDTQLHGPQTRFVLTPKAESEIGATLKNASQWIPLEKRSSDLLRNVAESDIFIPGSGIAKSLFQRCSDAGVAAAILLIFCAEGDNITESLQLAAYIESYFKWLPRMQNKSETERIPWKIPSSWQLQFGSHLDQALY